MDYVSALLNYPLKIPMAVAQELPLFDGGGSRSHGLCAMQMVAWIAGEKNTDHPECASPVVSDVVIKLNDESGVDVRESLKSRFSSILGSADPSLEETRAIVLIRAIVSNINEVFTCVEGDDREKLTSVIEAVNVAVAPGAEAISMVKSISDQKLALTSIRLSSPGAMAIKDSLYEFRFPNFDALNRQFGGLIRSVSPLDEFFGSDWLDYADPDPKNPQPGARALAILDQMLAVTTKAS